MATTSRTPQGAKVLIVDHDPDLLLATSITLRDHGYAVLEAATGHDCLEAVRTHDPDLVLLDVNLPDMTGLEVCRQIKTDRVLRKVFVILTSGIDVSPESQANGLNMGADGYIVKPVTGDALLARVNSMARIKRAEEAVRASEERLRNLFKTSRDGIFVFDQETLRIMSANPAASLLYGYSEEEFLEMKISQVSAEPEKTAAAIKGSSTNVPFRLHHKKDGSLFPVEITGGYFEEDGRVLSTAYIRDITDRVRAEAALKESRLQLAEAADLAKIVYWEHDEARDEFIFNDAFYKLLATTAEREGGYRMQTEKYFRVFLHPDDFQELWPMVQEIKGRLDEEGLTQFEHRAVRRDGEIIRILSRMTLIKDVDGHIVRVMGVNQDVTALKESEEALRRSEAKYRSIFQNAIEGIYQRTQEGKLLSVNPALARMHGYPSPEEMVSEVVGKALIKPFVDGGERKRYENLLERDGVVKGFEAELYRKDRSKFWVSFNSQAVKDSSGKVLYYEGMIEDITERRTLEDQLRQSQKMEAVGTLAGGVAHDFNNILTVIMGLGALLQADMDEDHPHRPFIDQILSSSEKAADLTKSLLAFSRKQRIAPESYDVNKVVANAAKLLKRLLHEDIELKLDLTNEDATARIDVTLIEQVLMNLATNARDAMPRGGSFTITTRAITLDQTFKETHGFGSPGRYVLLSVSDTGVGMDKETAVHIFDPFFTTKEVGKGTGLGLASVYGIVKQHGGYITVSSKPLKGTTFDLYLALADSADRQASASTVRIERGTETLLIVEDDRDVRSMIKLILEGHGYATMEAVDGIEAIRIYREHKDKIGLVILDVVMPGKSGRDVLDEIIAMNPDAKAVFMSGYTGDIVIGKGVERDSIDYLPKPLSVTQLLMKVREILDR